MDLPSLTTAATSLKLAKEALDAILGIRDFNAVATKVALVNEQLLKTQDSLFMHTAKMADLQQELLRAREELSELKKKAEDREKYELFSLSDRVFVYRLKQCEERNKSVPGTREPVHYLCQRCFDASVPIKSILQRLSDFGKITLDCTHCGAKYPTGESGSSCVAFSDGPRDIYNPLEP